ncbi:hypothetical protein CG51_11585 [Haematobacter missouriensis]|nr:hypothetical protein CG51_11585 [Haematobacter missouriensis]
MIGGSTRPGSSTVVESTSNQSGAGARRTKAVPRTSVMLSTGSRRAMRWATSTSARSALP